MHLCTSSKKLTRLEFLDIIAPLRCCRVDLVLCASPFPFKEEIVIKPPGLGLSLTFDPESLQLAKHRRANSQTKLCRQHAGTKGLRQGLGWEEEKLINKFGCLFFFKLLTMRRGKHLTWEAESMLFLMCALKHSMLE